ncbi:MAG: FecR family protein [Emticicia sp.]|uniref:FecR family protein n=1 Tax=Emticicia sp. TaxID=1930953 RepID=UPI003BA67769
MSKDQFNELLRKYLEGKCTHDEIKLIEQWYGALDGDNPASDVVDKNELQEKLWHQIQSKMYQEDNEESSDTPILRWQKTTWISIAASILIVCSWLWLTKTENSTIVNITATISETEWIEQKNTSAGTITVELEEGSTVKLSSNSIIRFPKHFSPQKREVYLTGDAFFEVKKRPSQPFYVYANDVITKVLGTSFYVRTEEKTKQVKVEVMTGRVAVLRKSSDEKKQFSGVILTPNHSVTYFNEEQHFVTGLVENPIVIQTDKKEEKTPNFRFNDTPLSEVLETLKDAYGIQFMVDNEKQYNCLLTANLNNKPLATQLELICAALHTKFEIQGTTILLSGKGCN